MGQSESSEEEKLFESLDKDKSGDLNLEELLRIQDVPDVPFTQSPLLLFKYDTAQEGKITKNEFVKLVHHFQQESKKVQKKVKAVSEEEEREHQQHAHAAHHHHHHHDEGQAGGEGGGERAAGGGGGGSENGLFARLRKASLHRSRSEASLAGGGGGGGSGGGGGGGGGSCGRVWTCVDAARDRAELDLSRDSATPMLTGRVRLEPPPPSEKAKLEEQLLEPPVRTDKLIRKLLRSKEGRQRFLDWLFRLADVEQCDAISVADLALLLQALAKDGIRPEDLSYDPPPQPSGGPAAGSPAASLAFVQHLLQEYDLGGHTGYLTRDEFMVLGELILRNYQVHSAAHEDGEVRVKNYQLGRKLGAGSSGVVRLATRLDPASGEPESGAAAKRAIKIIHRGDVTDMSRLDVEIKAMLLLAHPRVIRLEEVLEDAEHVYFVMELCGGGSLADYLATRPLGEALARFYFRQLVEGVAYCHSQGVCHRDLKLENLLLSNEGNLKISDFGHAGIFSKGWDVFSTSLVGSLWHLAPEQIERQAYRGERVDAWAMGVALFRMLAGRPPFDSPNPPEVLQAIREVRYVLPAGLSPEAADLLQRLLVLAPERRLSLDDMLRHVWLGGDTKAPNLGKKQLSIGKWADIEVPWHLMCDVVKQLDVFAHVVAPEGSHTALRKILKCQIPEQHLKFSICFKNKKTSNPFFEFALREGESAPFQEWTDKIRARFEARMQQDGVKDSHEQRATLLDPAGPHLIEDYVTPLPLPLPLPFAGGAGSSSSSSSAPSPRVRTANVLRSTTGSLAASSSSPSLAQQFQQQGQLGQGQGQQSARAAHSHSRPPSPHRVLAAHSITHPHHAHAHPHHMGMGMQLSHDDAPPRHRVLTVSSDSPTSPATTPRALSPPPVALPSRERSQEHVSPQRKELALSRDPRADKPADKDKEHKDKEHKEKEHKDKEHKEKEHREHKEREHKEKEHREHREHKEKEHREHREREHKDKEHREHKESHKEKEREHKDKDREREKERERERVQLAVSSSASPPASSPARVPSPVASPPPEH